MSQTLRIVLDRGLCQGHAVCTGESAAHFRLAPNGTLELIKTDVSLEEREAVEAAVRYCPNSSLRLEPSSS
jgi:sterol 14-demethylase